MSTMRTPTTIRTAVTVAATATLLTALLSGCSPGSSISSSAAPGNLEAARAPAAGCTIPAKLRGQDIERLPVTDKVVALTFDAGANADGVHSILATLSAEHVRASFFLTGNFVNVFPVKSRAMSAYVVGNHSMTHPDLTKLSDAAVRREVLDAQAAIIQVTGHDPRRFFRFPFGARDDRIIGIVNSLCYVGIRWTVDSLGWEGTSGGMTVPKVVARVVDAAQPGEIVLMHVGSNPDDGSTLDAHALPTIIDRLRDLGYSFVTLARLMSPAP